MCNAKPDDVRAEEDHELSPPRTVEDVDDHPGAFCVGFLFAFSICSLGELIGERRLAPDSSKTDRDPTDTIAQRPARQR